VSLWIAAIANAVFNATGKRIKNLPITLDKVLSIRVSPPNVAPGEKMVESPVFAVIKRHRQVKQ
jgi:hypothetical protein